MSLVPGQDFGFLFWAWRSGHHRVLRFREKGGKDREIPVRHDLAIWLDEYIAVDGIADDRANREESACLFLADTHSVSGKITGWRRRRVQVARDRCAKRLSRLT